MLHATDPIRRNTMTILTQKIAPCLWLGMKKLDIEQLELAYAGKLAAMLGLGA
jgi:hypothetical protein